MRGRSFNKNRKSTSPFLVCFAVFPICCYVLLLYYCAGTLHRHINVRPLPPTPPHPSLSLGRKGGGGGGGWGGGGTCLYVCVMFRNNNIENSKYFLFVIIFSSVKTFGGHGHPHWCISNFWVIGKRFREAFSSLLSRFSERYPSIFGPNCQSKMCF